MSPGLALLSAFARFRVVPAQRLKDNPPRDRSSPRFAVIFRVHGRAPVGPTGLRTTGGRARAPRQPYRLRSSLGRRGRHCQVWRARAPPCWRATRGDFKLILPRRPVRQRAPLCLFVGCRRPSGFEREARAHRAPLAPPPPVGPCSNFVVAEDGGVLLHDGLLEGFRRRPVPCPPNSGPSRREATIHLPPPGVSPPCSEAEAGGLVPSGRQSRLTSFPSVSVRG